MSDDPKPGNNPEDPSDIRPYLCIPYWDAPLHAGGSWDTGGVRPLPQQVLSYACQSIHAGPYVPGQPLDVTVDVRNSGGGSATVIATVVVYWADPTVGFAKPNFFAAATVAVSPSRTSPSVSSTAKMTATIPASAPDHVCLVAYVSHAQDRAGTACDPIHDRHWAQHNLQAVAAAPGAPVIAPLTVANPLNVAGDFQLTIGAVAELRMSAVAAVFGTRPSGIGPRLTLLNDDGSSAAQGTHINLPLSLGPLSQQRFRLLLELDREIQKGQSASVEALLLPADSDSGDPVGSLGLVLIAPD